MTDPETGEIVDPAVLSGENRYIGMASTPGMPPVIAAALFKVLKEAKQLGFDEKNDHSKYSYVSIDKFLAAFRPMMAEAGIMILVDELEPDVREGRSDPDRPERKAVSWMFGKYDVTLLHESGVMWGPLRRHLALPLTGAQTFGAAESYIQKRLLRGLFMVPTGDRDADDLAADDNAPAGRSGARQAKRIDPAVSQSTPARDAAREAHKRLQAAIDEAGSIDELTAVYNPLRQRWGEEFAESVAAIADFAGPQYLDPLRLRAAARYQAFAGDKP